MTIFYLLQTSLLLHIADEMPHAAGITIKRGQISYSAQDPWIVQDTVRENILFGQTHISTRYTEVLQVCGLNEVCTTNQIHNIKFLVKINI